MFTSNSAAVANVNSAGFGFDLSISMVDAVCPMVLSYNVQEYLDADKLSKSAMQKQAETLVNR
jgi:hypothetical protein